MEFICKIIIGNYQSNVKFGSMTASSRLLSASIKRWWTEGLIDDETWRGRSGTVKPSPIRRVGRMLGPLTKDGDVR